MIAHIPPQKSMLPRDGRTARTNAQRLALEARVRAKSEAGVWAKRRRMADAEGVIAELKNQHGLDRVRCRGTPAFHVQLLVGCAAINLKRLAAHAPAAHEGIAAAPKAAATVSSAHDDHQPVSRRASIRFGRCPLTWTTTLCLN